MLASEADVLRTLRAGTYTLEQLYALCEERAPVGRDRGHDPVPDHAGDTRWKRRVRGALQGLRRRGRAERIGRSSWALQGTTERPSRLLLIVAGGEPREFELRLRDAVALLAELEEPIDLVLCDPPWALRRGSGHFADGNGYRRDHTRVVPGYVDVDVGVERYLEFTHGWVTQAAARAQARGAARGNHGPAARRDRAARGRERAAHLGEFDRGAARVPARHPAAPGQRALDDHRHVPRRAGQPQARVQPAQGPAGRAQRAPLPARLVGGRQRQGRPAPLAPIRQQPAPPPGAAPRPSVQRPWRARRRPVRRGRHHRDRVLADRTTVHRRRPQPARDQIHRRPTVVRARLAGRSPTQPALRLGASGRRPGTYIHRRFPCL